MTPYWLAALAYVVVHGPEWLTAWNEAVVKAVAKWRKPKQ